MRGVLEETGALEQLEAGGITIPMYLLISVFMALTYAPLINMFVALGEEVGYIGIIGMIPMVAAAVIVCRKQTGSNG